MTVLRFGLTPKMKPVSPRRAAMVAALDIGTSKIVCLIARLEPQAAAGRAAPAQPRRARARLRPYRGERHEGRRAWSTWSPPRRWSATPSTSPRAWPACSSNRWWSRCPAAGSAANASSPTSSLPAAPSTDGDIARVLAAASRHSVRDGRAVLHSLPIGYALDAATGIREPRGMLGHRFGVDMHMVTADVATVAQPDAGGRAQPSRRSRRWWPRPTWPGSGRAGRRRGRSRRRRASISAPARRPWRCFPAAASSMPTASRSAAIT